MLIDHNMKYFMLFSFFLDFDFEDLIFYLILFFSLVSVEQRELGKQKSHCDLS